eukprot:CAMPEP_0185571268 /NCGR_PEP_ID=MMETSP0434-20130131/3316_1 /TAXON_ID=626734 ORGANISM="Favella taraikaensis, Strain Fe Narragansett Bay" /NCGR_SAMPLE_ID=MMETSP0434 /ASSEMBLY_ACC=CAM_ASM_000379 /LENGTH=154 /DNA_ID=CAMNT_0028186603 /DNA_START=522 /DNA_END=986 /DNA_ORIENTATION=-
MLHISHTLLNQLNDRLGRVPNLKKFTAALIEHGGAAVRVADEHPLVVCLRVPHQILVEKTTLIKTLHEKLQLAHPRVQMVVLLGGFEASSDRLSALLQVLAKFGGELASFLRLLGPAVMDRSGLLPDLLFDLFVLLGQAMANLLLFIAALSELC